MLVYNFQKEFLGIDDSDLRKMGFKNLSELRAEAADFADLFVKTPGFIHNFKHVHWIDFVECAESDDSANVIIHANNKNFRCTIEVQTAFLVDAPTQQAYIIYLNNLRELSKFESNQVANDVYEKPTPQAATTQTTKLQTQKSSHEFDIPKENTTPTKAIYDPYEQEQTEEPIDILDTPTPYIEEDAPIELDIQNNNEQVESFSDDDFKLDIDVEDTDEILTLATEPEPTTTTTTATTIIEEEEDDDDIDFDTSYVYDPNVASNELGLPLDLIEEFISDFIAQAHEFKDQLYTALKQEDEDKIKILSHKLKGVAANLRIEDAFEVLSIINTSTNYNKIKLNLNRLYKIIAKLSNEEVAVTPTTESVAQTPTTTVQEIPEEDDEDFSISFKDDEDLKIDEPLEVNQLKDTSDIGYNKVATAQKIGIDSDSFNELFDDFIDEGGLLIKDINRSIREKNIKLWKRNALKLKGMADNMRIDSLKKDLDTLMQADDVNVAKEAIGRVQTSLEKISKL